MSTEIKAGDRVRITVSTEKRDPWLTPKNGWEGIAVAPTLNMEATHWQIKFVEPWCSLGITRIMPISSIIVIGGPEAEALPSSSPNGPIETPQLEAKIDTTEEVRSEQMDEPEDILGDFAEEAGMDEKSDPDSEFDKNNIPPTIDKDQSFELNTLVRVKNKAGSTTGEEHIIKRRGMTGKIIRLCEIATSCVEVEFEEQRLPVMIPKSGLQAISADSSDFSAKKRTSRKIKASQMTLPF